MSLVGIAVLAADVIAIGALVIAVMGLRRTYEPPSKAARPTDDRDSDPGASETGRHRPAP